DDHAFRAGQQRTKEEFKAMLDAFLAGVETKGRLLQHYRAARPWDLFIGVFGESHGAGHQFWHLHDNTHPRFDQAIVDFLGGDPIRQIYRALDAALGRLLDTIDRDATVLVMMSHGMRAHHDGTHLLEEVLRRIDVADRKAAGAYSWRDAARHELRI